MDVSFYAVVSRGGKVKAVKTKPALAWDEIAIAVTISIPRHFFERPVLSAKITIPDAMIADATQEAIIDVIAPSIADALGVSVGDVTDGLGEAIECARDRERPDGPPMYGDDQS